MWVNTCRGPWKVTTERSVPSISVSFPQCAVSRRWVCPQLGSMPPPNIEVQPTLPLASESESLNDDD